jgi:pyruvate dehydrogenase E2 component (dihydrolipoamide acetyltransferase)
MAVKEITLPELGEDVENGDVVEVLVSEGDTIEKDQPVIEVETEKASVEIPAPFGGTVKEIQVKAGDTVQVGQTLLTVETEEKEEEKEEGESETASAEARREPEAAAEAERKAREKEKEAAEEKEDEGEDREEKKGREEREARAEKEPPAKGKGEEERPEPEGRGREAEREEAQGPAEEKGEEGRREVAPAGPSVRRLARELGIDIHDVSGSGPRGRISEQDVKDFARRLIREKGAEEPSAEREPPGRMQPPPLPDFSRWGETEREPMGALRRKATKTTSTSWAQIPHVTQFDRADVTELERDRKHLSKALEREGAKLTVTAILIKLAALALKRFPRFNASLDLADETIVYKHYVNVGVAVDTDRGLVVPVIRDADRKNLSEVAVELNDLAEKARTRKLGLESMSGSNFSVTNLGGLGTTYFTPIVTWPDVAVLGVGRANTEAILEDGAFVPRLILPLSVSYDHRVIDGADASRFLRWIAESLERPLKVLMEG